MTKKHGKGGMGDPKVLSFTDICKLLLVLNAFKFFKISFKSQKTISHCTSTPYKED